MGLSSSTPATIKFTVGVPGSGKSYTRVRWILEEFIPNQDGILYTNLPSICLFWIAWPYPNGLFRVDWGV